MIRNRKENAVNAPYTLKLRSQKPFVLHAKQGAAIIVHCCFHFISFSYENPLQTLQ